MSQSPCSLLGDQPSQSSEMGQRGAAASADLHKLTRIHELLELWAQDELSRPIIFGPYIFIRPIKSLVGLCHELWIVTNGPPYGGPSLPRLHHIQRVRGAFATARRVPLLRCRGVKGRERWNCGQVGWAPRFGSDRKPQRRNLPIFGPRRALLGDAGGLQYCDGSNSEPRQCSAQSLFPQVIFSGIPSGTVLLCFSLK